MRGFAFLVPVVAVAAVASGLSPAEASAGGTISGKVTNTHGAPLAGVTVRVSPLDTWDDPATQVTGPTGEFSLADLPAGGYTVCFLEGEATPGGPTTSGYSDMCWRDVRIPDGIRDWELTRVDVADGTTVRNINQVLPETAAIAGQVVDNAGQPVAQARVTISAPWSYGARGRAITGADGRYRVEGLYSGDYFVCVSASEVTGGSSTTGYLDSCIGGQQAMGAVGNAVPEDELEATSVHLAPGATATAPTISLAPAAQVRGTVTDAAGQPLSGVKVYAAAADVFDMTATDITDAEGHYLLSVDNDGGQGSKYHGTRLPPVGIRLHFRPPTSAHVSTYYPHVPAVGSQYAWGPPTYITPATGSPTVLDDFLPLAGSISGTVTDMDGAGVQRARVVIRHGGKLVEEKDTASDGNYAVDGLPQGDYTVCFTGWGAFGGGSTSGYLDSCFGGAPPETPEVVSLGLAEDRTDVDGQLPPGAKIAGTVRNADGEGIYGVDVSVQYADGTEAFGGRSQWDGSYEVYPVRPGAWSVCFEAASDASAPYLPTCWSDGTGAGRTPVTTTAGAVSRADITLKRRPLDLTPPVVSFTTPSTMFVSGRTIKVTPAFSDASTEPIGYQVRYRVASWNGSGFGGWVYPGSWANLGGPSVTMTGTPGRTYCFSIKAWDVVQNISAWSPERCRAVPLDDRSLTASRGWTRRTDKRAFGATLARSNTRGATLRLTGASVTRLALVVTTCPTCGKVGVYVGSRLVSTISTYSATSRRQVVRLASRIAPTRGTVTLRVAQRRTVIVDGLIVTRR